MNFSAWSMKLLNKHHLELNPASHNVQMCSLITGIHAFVKRVHTLQEILPDRNISIFV